VALEAFRLACAARLPIAIAFLGGAFYEALAVAWVHYAERKRALAAALCSSAVACALVLGIGESLRSHAAAVAFVFGYGFGTYVAVRLKRG